MLSAVNQTQRSSLKGTLHLVDLAGSERLNRSNATGDRLKETVAINKSLSSLTDVFVSISNKSTHVRNFYCIVINNPFLTIVAKFESAEKNPGKKIGCSLRHATLPYIHGIFKKIGIFFSSYHCLVAFTWLFFTACTSLFPKKCIFHRASRVHLVCAVSEYCVSMAGAVHFMSEFFILVGIVILRFCLKKASSLK